MACYYESKNHNVLYAATSEGVWKTNNAGGNWAQILNYQMAMDLEINPVDTSIYMFPLEIYLMMFQMLM
jgi:hypothetical protein